MLVLTRRPKEVIVIDGEIEIEILEVIGNRVRVGITAPRGITILRQELLLRDQKLSGNGAVAVCEKRK